MVQGFRFDPDGEYVRQWLPELARIPTEWIHHPWDAPVDVLTSAGVDLGSNYPHPIVDVDSARVGLTEAISIMHASIPKVVVKGTDEVVFDNSETYANSSIPKVVVKGTDEVVFDNSETYANSSIPKVVVKGRPPFSAISSYDHSRSKKRQERCLKDGRIDAGETSKMDDDLSSTAESPSNKKRSTSSGYSFSVPQCCSAMSNSTSAQVQDSSDVMDRWQEENDSEQMMNGNGSPKL
ncbi:cryptochrome-1 [Dorcoceras hygrometricum]|uniref:Cryptochrome-1 n=1 Tax=Dorcoceras hygrometricum TaxID=472368 RepID=A0A2Z7C2T0_9LAMI|nr:cryptochrome-1 [Dorcoceras hygrometricum]